MDKSTVLSSKFFERLERNFVEYADKVAISYNKITKRFSSVEIFDYCKRNGVTASSFMHAAFAETIHRITRENEFLYTTVNNGRSADNALQNCTGMFVQTLPVVVNSRQLSATSSQSREDGQQLVANSQKPAVDHGDLLVTDYVRSFHANLQKTFANDCYPYTKFSECHKTSTEIMFIYQDSILGGNVLMDDKSIEVFRFDGDKPVFPVNILVYPIDDGFELRIEYDCMKYCNRYMQTLAEAIANTAINMTNAEFIKDVSLVSEEQKDVIIRLSAGEKLEYDKTQTWVDMFRHQAAEHPNTVAVVDSHSSITYRELDRQSDSIAAYLLNKGVKTNDFVAVKIGRVKEFVTAVLGINKAGAAYVPVDPDYPEERIGFMLEDSSAKAVVTETIVAEALQKYKNAESVNNSTIDGLAYMIYTSGTTGKPKGAMILHRGLRAFIAWNNAEFRQCHGTSHLVHASFSFDASVFDMLCPLAAGSTVHILGEELRRDLAGVNDYITANNITGMLVNTSVGMELLGSFEPGLKYIMLGGEKMLPVRKTGAKVYNAYGPTEFTAASTFYPVNHTEKDVPIGRPVPNSYGVVCDKYGHLLPQGIAGELCFAGEQIGAGYWKRPELTEKVFSYIADDNFNGQKFYHTGDLARYNEDGNIEYLGRIDTQVKLRGFRIELGEIDNVASQFAGMKQVIAQVKKLGTADSLVLYYSADRQIKKDELKSFMAKSLTDYMVPTVFMQLDEMPMTPNGKIDRKKLPEPEIEVAEIIVPADETEQKLFDIASEVLKTDKFGVTTSLISMGMSSLMSMKFAASVQKQMNVKVSVADIMKHQTIRLIAENIGADNSVTAVKAYPKQELYPLTENQRGLYIDWEMHRDTTQYNIPIALKFTDKTAEGLANAVRTAFAAHGYLKTRFVQTNEDVMQKSCKEKTEILLQKLETEPDAAFFQSRVRPFNLLNERLYRVEIYSAPKAVYLFMDIHHIIYDGLSSVVLMNDIFSAYDGRPVEHEKITAYDFALHEKELLAGEAFTKAEARFDSLVGEAASVNYPASAKPDGEATGTVTASVAADIVDSFCRKNSVTVSSFMQAAFAETLHRITREENPLYVTISNGRLDGATIERSMGMFVKTLPVVLKSCQPSATSSQPREGEFEAESIENARIDKKQVLGRQPLADSRQQSINSAQTHAEQSVSDYVRSIHEQLQESYASDFYPYTRVVERHGIHAGVMFSYQGGIYDRTDIAEKGIELVKLNLDTVKFPVDVTVYPENGRYVITVEYDGMKYCSHDIQILAESVANIAVGMTKAEKVRDISLVSEEQKTEILKLSCGEKFDFDRNQTWIDLFKKQVCENAEHIAVVDTNSSMTYAELDEQSDTVAAYLSEKGVKAEDFVAVKMSRCKEFISAVIALHKLGAGYIPIDDDAPEDRILYMMEDSEARLMLDDAEIQKALKSGKKFAGKSVATPDSIAYMIYTSGSTGRPKGVVIQHRAMFCFINFIRSRWGLTCESRITCHSNFAFDAAVEDLYPVLTVGGTLYIIPEDIRMDIIMLRRYLKDNRITGGSYTTQLGQMLGSDYELDVDYICVGGEKMVAVPQTAGHVYNAYGPTEFTVDATYFELDRNREYENIPIGRPLYNCAGYVVDSYGQLVPQGVVGELCLAGPQMAKEYWKRPELTAEKFEVLRSINTKVYHTGDLVRYNEENQLEYLGRIDFQVKLRGFRIELGEVDSRAAQFDGIGHVIAQVKKIGGTDNLVLYYSAENQIDKKSLRAFMAETLPEFMVPTVFMQLEKMPLNANGKIDRKALPEPVITRNTEYAAPVTDVERKLAECMQKILGATDKIGVNDNFFELGGDSIKAIRLVSLLRQNGLIADAASIMKYKTLKAISEICSEADEVLQISQEPWTGEIADSPIIKEFYGQNLPKPSHYNQSSLLKCAGKADTAMLQKVFEALSGQHDLMRSIVKNGHLYIAGADNIIKLEEYDLTGKSDVFAEIRSVGLDMKSHIDMGKALMRAAVLRTDEADYLFITAHHFIIDGISWRILISDLESAYRQLKSGAGEIRLPAKTHTYSDYVKAAYEYSRSYRLSREIPFWKSVIDRLPEKTWKQQTRTEKITVMMSEDRTHSFLTANVSRFNGEVNDMLMCAVCRSWQKTMKRSRLSVEMEGHGREDIGAKLLTDRTIGWFTSVFPVIFDDITGDIGSDLINAKETLHRVPDKGVGYNILKYLNSEAFGSSSDNRAADMLFNYLGEMDAEPDSDSEFRIAGEIDTGDDWAPENIAGPAININCLVNNGQFNLDLDYNPELYSRELMTGFAEGIISEMTRVSAYISECDSDIVTASDLGETEWSQKEFEAVVKDFANRGEALQRIYPLTSMQEGILLKHLQEPDSWAYRLVDVLEISAVPSEKQLENVLEKLGNKHEVLRTAIIHKNVHIYRQAIINRRLGLRMVDLSGEKNPEKAVLALREKILSEDYDLQEKPLFQITYAKKSENSGYLIIANHHIIIDGWGFSLYLKDLFSFLTDELGGRNTAADTSLDGRYETAVRELLERDKYTGLEYWKNLLSEYETCAEIPSYREIPEEKRDRAGEQIIALDKELTDKLIEIAKSENATVSNVAEMLWGLVLQTYSRSEDVMFAKVVSGRDKYSVDVNNVVGLFINSVPVRIRTDNTTTARELLNALQKQAVETSEWDFCPLSEILSSSGIDSGLLKSVFAFENYNSGNESSNKFSETDSIGVKPVLMREENFDDFSSSSFVDDKGCLCLHISYNSRKYSRSDVECVLRLFRTLAGEVCENPDKPLSRLSKVDSEQKEQILKLSAGEKLEYDRTQTWVDMFKHQVEEHPDTVAVVDNVSSITYRELDRQSDSIAAYLLNNGVKTNDFVAVKIGRVKEFITAVLGINKAGAAYVPIDLEYPEDRIAYMVEDCGAKHVLTEKIIAEVIEQNADTEPVNNTSPDAHAYMIYTSGSTGKPKGVVINHKAVTACAAWNIKDFKLDSTKRNLHHPSFSFDASTFDLFYPLAAGAAVHILDEEQRKNMDGIADYIKQNRITGMTMSTAMGMALLNQYDLDIEYIMLGGEKFMPVRKTSTKLFNGYGPTEFTVCSSYHVIDQEKDIDIPIGRSVPNSYSVICDSYGNLMPDGIAGELWLAGDQISEGYWNRPELNAERFAPLAVLGNQPVYRTGDIARYNEDGELEYLGRIDFQVKLRGFRIELGEIDNVASQFNGIKQVIAQVKKFGSSDSLVLYYSADRQIDKNELKAFMGKSLTDYMVPTVFMQLDEMPMTPNGKIDRKKLPEPEIEAAEIVAPANETEQKLFDIVSEMLKTDNFGVTTSLISMGMSSLMSMRFAAAVQKRLGVKLNVADIMKHQTIRDIASNLGAEDTVLIKSYPKQELYPLTENQRGLYIDWEMHRDTTQYNIPMVLKFTDKTAEGLEKAVRTAFAAHGYLKTRLVLIAEDVLQKPCEEETEILVQKFESEPDTVFFQSRVRPFDLLSERLYRIEIYNTPKSVYLFMDIHHIIYDGLSSAVLINDILAAYDGKLIEAEKITAYDFALHEKEILAGEAFNKAEVRFDSLVGDAAVVNYSASEKPDGKVTGTVTASVAADIVDRFCKKNSVTANSFMQAAFAETLHRITREENPLYITISNGRLDGVAMEHSMGMFVKTLPVVLDSRQLSATSSQPRAGELEAESIENARIDKKQVLGRQPLADSRQQSIDSIRTHAEQKVSDFVRSIHEQLQESYANDFYPYTRIVERHGLHAGVMFIYQGGLYDGISSNEDLFEGIPLKLDAVKLPIAFTVYPRNGEYVISVEYDGMKYSSCDMQTLVDAFTNAAISMTSAVRVKDVSLVSKEQETSLLKLSVGEKIEYNKTQTWVDMFKHQAAEHPDTVAVVDHISSITYKELDSQSDSVAAYLLNKGVKGNDFVAIKMGRVKEFIIAVLGINKAGAAYVPIDPEYPEDRIAYMVEDCGAKHVLTEKVIAEAIEQNTDTEPVNNTSPDAHAYMIYTSGSTGKPKGVVIKHKAVTACAAWNIKDFKLDSTKRNLHHPSFSFDASTFDLFYPLAAGAAVHILDEEQRKNMDGIADYIKQNRITGMTMSTAIGMALLNQYDLDIEYIMLGGEKFMPVRKTSTKLFNGYGPTEFTVCSSYHVIDQEKDINIPIGRSVPNSYSVICDSYGNLMPDGIAGELCLAGDQISDGYWNRTELNAEKFAPISALGNQPVYRTGDLARYNEDGELEYLGRIDFQVKLRGFRIELGEIDNVASQFAGMKQVIAQVKKIGLSDVLVLYYSTTEQVDKEALKVFMAKSLTDYMVPTVFMQLDEMPMTPNGKIDRKALPAPTISEASIKNVPPSSAVEMKALEFAKEIITGVEFGVTDDLIELGMNSLSVMKYVAKLRIISKKIRVSDVMRYRNIRDLLEGRLRILWSYETYDPNKPVLISIHGIVPISGHTKKYESWKKNFNIFILEPIDEHSERLFADSLSDMEEVISFYSLLLNKAIPQNADIFGFIGFSWGGEVAIRLANEMKLFRGINPIVIMGDTYLANKKNNEKITAKDITEEFATRLSCTVDGLVYKLNLVSGLVSEEEKLKYDGKVVYLNAKKESDFITDTFKRRTAKKFFRNVEFIDFENEDHYGLFVDESIIPIYYELLKRLLNDRK